MIEYMAMSIWIGRPNAAAREALPTISDNNVESACADNVRLTVNAIGLPRNTG